MSVRDVALVASGGALGAVLRYVFGIFCTQLLGSRFPWGTFVVNVLGCFLLGWLLQAAASSTVSDATKLALGTGLLGAFTTFSTFSVETIHAWHRAPAIAVSNVVAGVAVGIMAAAAGMYLAERLAAT